MATTTPSEIRQTISHSARTEHNGNNRLINGFVVPPPLKIQPLKALKAVFRLLRNKEDTTQVFAITNALSGDAGINMFQRFIDTDYGQEVINKPIILEDVLADFERLRAMPSDSFGRAYLDFMESGDLSPDGIIDVAEESGIAIRDNDHPEYSRFFMHMDTSHDVWHVVTGYNRDALGEISLLVYTREQSKNNSLMLIVAMGALAMKKERWSTPIFKVLKEARMMGQQSAWLPATDLVALMPLPLEEVRRKLNIEPPVKYGAIPVDVLNGFLKPVSDKQTASQNTEKLNGTSCC